MPPCGALTSTSSRRLATFATTSPAVTVSPDSRRTSTSRVNVPLIGATSRRQVGEASISDGLPCLSTNARASSSWSGVFSANVSTPFRARRAIPVSVPAGGSSRMPVTSRSAMVCMHRSQRTGAFTWLTSRRRTSRPSWTTWPSRFEIRRVRGSWVLIAVAYFASVWTAGSMCLVWKAPATDSGISRVLAGGSAASAASSSTVPAATIWPGPLSLAAVSPCSASLARISSRSPPRTAVIEVAVCAAAAAIALPRSRTRTIACSAVSTPVPAAAASSPTL